MATKNIVPNGNGEGGIGVTGKRWNTGFINTITGNLTGNVTGNTSGTAATVTGAAQSNITSLGTLTSLTLSGNLIIPNDGTIGSAGTNGALTISSGGTATFSGVVNIPVGAEGAPSLIFAGDSDSGMWHPAANTLAFSTFGNERLRISSGGNVGIGDSGFDYYANN
jgi:hypothetical protein